MGSNRTSFPRVTVWNGNSCSSIIERRPSLDICRSRCSARPATITTILMIWSRLPSAMRRVSTFNGCIGCGQSIAMAQTLPFICWRYSEAQRRRNVVLLSLSDQGPAMAVAANAILHHVPSVDVQTGVCYVRPSGHQLHGRCAADATQQRSRRRRRRR